MVLVTCHIGRDLILAGCLLPHTLIFVLAKTKGVLNLKQQIITKNKIQILSVFSDYMLWCSPCEQFSVWKVKNTKGIRINVLSNTSKQMENRVQLFYVNRGVFAGGELEDASIFCQLTFSASLFDSAWELKARCIETIWYISKTLTRDSC